MSLYSRITLTALALAAVATPALAQVKRGTWEGSSNTQQGTQPITVVLDSGATGWKGSVISAQTPDSIRLVEVGVAADTLSFGIPINNLVVYISGLVSGDKFNGGIWYQNTQAGTIQLTRKPAPGEKPPPSKDVFVDNRRRSK
jgi:hypothetical protein